MHYYPSTTRQLRGGLTLNMSIMCKQYDSPLPQPCQRYMSLLISGRHQHNKPSSPSSYTSWTIQANDTHECSVYHACSVYTQEKTRRGYYSKSLRCMALMMLLVGAFSWLTMLRAVTQQFVPS